MEAIHNHTQDVVLGQNITRADTLCKRLVGLLSHTQLANGEGLWIIPCNSIHSIGMRFAFDALFLDHDLRVVHLIESMRPWRLSRMIWKAKSVLELPAGTIARTGTQLGDQLRADPVTSTLSPS